MNGFGRLYSSDLPIYLTKEQVGCLVPASMREPWELFYEGDGINLPRILSTVRSIDLFHYDSDKSVAAKEQVFAMIRPQMAPYRLTVVDNIDRDAFFRRVAARWGRWAHWPNSSQRHRWLATALLDIEPHLRKVMGYRHLPTLRIALNRELKINTTTSKRKAA